MPWYRSSEGLFFCFFCSFNPEVEAWNLSDIFFQLEFCFPPVLLKDFPLIDLYKKNEVVVIYWQSVFVQREVLSCSLVLEYRWAGATHALSRSLLEPLKTKEENRDDDGACWRFRTTLEENPLQCHTPSTQDVEIRQVYLYSFDVMIICTVHNRKESLPLLLDLFLCVTASHRLS